MRGCTHRTHKRNNHPLKMLPSCLLLLLCLLPLGVLARPQVQPETETGAAVGGRIGTLVSDIYNDIIRSRLKNLLEGVSPSSSPSSPPSLLNIFVSLDLARELGRSSKSGKWGGRGSSVGGFLAQICYTNTIRAFYKFTR